MCEPFKSWGSQIIQKYGIAVVGFVFAAYVYVDFRDYMKENLHVLQEVAKSTAVHTEAIRGLTQSVEWLMRDSQGEKK